MIHCATSIRDFVFVLQDTLPHKACESPHMALRTTASGTMFLEISPCVDNDAFLCLNLNHSGQGLESDWYSPYFDNMPKRRFDAHDVSRLRCSVHGEVARFLHTGGRHVLAALRREDPFDPTWAVSRIACKWNASLKEPVNVTNSACTWTLHFATCSWTKRGANDEGDIGIYRDIDVSCTSCTRTA